MRNCESKDELHKAYRCVADYHKEQEYFDTRTKLFYESMLQKWGDNNEIRKRLEDNVESLKDIRNKRVDLLETIDESYARELSYIEEAEEEARQSKEEQV